MAQEDRITGLVGYSGVKVPVLAASTGALVLSGEQTVDGVALVTGNRCLVKNQASSIDNGIYVVDTGAWSRAQDADGPYDFRQGSLIYVYGGTVNGNSFFRCISADPIIAGTSALTFTAVNIAFSGASRSQWCGTATGTANALVLTPAVAIAAGDLQAGLSLVFKSGAAGNSGATTIAVSGNAAIAVQDSGNACVGGEIEASKWYRATLDGTGAAFQLERLAPAVLIDMFTAAGDMAVASADGVVGRLAVGSAGTIPMSRNEASQKLAYVAALTKSIYGLTYANNGADAVNDIDIAAGGAMETGSGLNKYWMTLAAGITKQSDVAWAVGTNAGGLDTGAVGNNDYYIHLIARSDTGVVDVLFSLSLNAPTMPANYDYRRVIGWFKRVGGTIVAFHTYELTGGGIELTWDAPTLDINLANTLTTARRTDAVKVPLTFSTEAHLNALTFDAGAAVVAWIYCPDQTDLAPNAFASPGSNIFGEDLAVGEGMQLHVRTSSAGLIAARANLATVDTYAVCTVGFKWARRN